MAKLKASEVLKKYGWVQGHYGDKENGYCAYGAVCEANMKNTKTRAAIFAKLSKYLIKKYHSDILTVWNDELGRTKKQVIGALKAIGQ